MQRIGKGVRRLALLVLTCGLAAAACVATGSPEPGTPTATAAVTQSVSTIPSTAAGAATRTYAHPDGWSFDYPSGWDRVEPGFVQETETGKTVQFTAEPATQEAVDSWIESEIGRKLSATEARNTLAEPLSVAERDGLRLYRYAIASEMEARTTLLETAVFFDGARRYEFLAAVPPVSHEEFEAILESFRPAQP